MGEDKKVYFNGEGVHIIHQAAAHTDGDVYVRFPGANVIVAGDAISPQVDPVLDWFGGGWLGGRVDAQKKLLELGDARTRYVPAFGAHLFLSADTGDVKRALADGYAAATIVASKANRSNQRFPVMVSPVAVDR